MTGNSPSDHQCVSERGSIRPAEDILWHLREATREAEALVRAGIIKVAVRNRNVSDYMNHWEGRALRAEAAVAKLRDALDTIRCVARGEGDVGNLVARRADAALLDTNTCEGPSEASPGRGPTPERPDAAGLASGRTP